MYQQRNKSSRPQSDLSIEIPSAIAGMNSVMQTVILFSVLLSESRSFIRLEKKMNDRLSCKAIINSWTGQVQWINDPIRYLE